MDSLSIIMDFLGRNSIQILSTIHENKPISRPIGSAFLAKNRIWFCMNNDKPMFAQLQQNPMISLCVCASDYSWLRLNAKVVFSDDMEIKQHYVNRKTSSFQDSNDPRLSIFYLSEITAEIHKKGTIEYYTAP